MMYTDSLSRAFCRIIVLYSCGTRPLYSTLTRHKVSLRPTCRQFSRIQYSQKSGAKLRSIDKVPTEYELIYRAPMNSYVKLAHVTSSVSILLLGAVGAYKYAISSSINFPLIIQVNENSRLGDIQIDGDFMFMISTFLVLNAAIYAVTLRYPLRIYHHKEASSYICVLNRFLPLNTRNISFRAGEVRRHIPLMSALIPWRDALFKVERRIMFIFEYNFRTPADFSTMLNKV